MMRAVHGSIVLYPSDATSTAALVEGMAVTRGISYLRTTRGAYPVLYTADEAFSVGGSKVHRSSENDDVTIIGAGVTLHAACVRQTSCRRGVHARVIDWRAASVRLSKTVCLTAASAISRG
jgi:transketolase